MVSWRNSVRSETTVIVLFSHSEFEFGIPNAQLSFAEADQPKIKCLRTGHALPACGISLGRQRCTTDLTILLPFSPSFLHPSGFAIPLREPVVST